MRRRAVGWLAVAMVCGCGTTIEQEDGGGGSGGAGGTTTSTSTGGDELRCPEYADAEATQDVDIRIRNQSGRAVYMKIYCSGLDERTITPTPPQDDLVFDDLAPCPSTCETEQRPQDACGDCANAAFRLDPDVSAEDVWSGTALRQVSMPAECWESGAGGACLQRGQAPAGEYALSVVVYDECPDCVCDDDGDCTGQPAGLTGTVYGSFSFPTLEQVEVFVEPCVFGCADQ